MPVRLAALLALLLLAAGYSASGSAAPQSFNGFWRNVDHCPQPAVTDDGTITTAIADCPDGRSVALVTVDGGGHDWPPFATQTLWQFFAAHPGL